MGPPQLVLEMCSLMNPVITIGLNYENIMKSTSLKKVKGEKSTRNPLVQMRRMRRVPSFGCIRRHATWIERGMDKIISNVEAS